MKYKTLIVFSLKQWQNDFNLQNARLAKKTVVIVHFWLYAESASSFFQTHFICTLMVA